MCKDMVDHSDELIDVPLLIYHILDERMHLSVGQRIHIHHKWVRSMAIRGDSLVDHSAVRCKEPSMPSPSRPAVTLKCPHFDHTAKRRIGGGIEQHTCVTYPER